MITAIVMVNSAVDRVPEVAQQIADLPEVQEVYSCAGPVDLIAIVKVRQHDELADVIAGRMSKIEGITATETHIAFRAYNSKDVDAGFSIGAEG